MICIRMLEIGFKSTFSKSLISIVEFFWVVNLLHKRYRLHCPGWTFFSKWSRRWLSFFQKNVFSDVGLLYNRDDHPKNVRELCCDPGSKLTFSRCVSADKKKPCHIFYDRSHTITFIHASSRLANVFECPSSRSSTGRERVRWEMLEGMYA